MLHILGRGWYRERITNDAKRYAPYEGRTTPNQCQSGITGAWHWCTKGTVWAAIVLKSFSSWTSHSELPCFPFSRDVVHPCLLNFMSYKLLHIWCCLMSFQTISSAGASFGGVGGAVLGAQSTAGHLHCSATCPPPPAVVRWERGRHHVCMHCHFCQLGSSSPLPWGRGGLMAERWKWQAFASAVASATRPFTPPHWGGAGGIHPCYATEFSWFSVVYTNLK